MFCPIAAERLGRSSSVETQLLKRDTDQAGSGSGLDLAAGCVFACLPATEHHHHWQVELNAAGLFHPQPQETKLVRDQGTHPLWRSFSNDSVKLLALTHRILAAVSA